MHDALYREQSAWSKAENTRELYESYAGTLGLDLNQFKKDMDSDKARHASNPTRRLAILWESRPPRHCL